MATNPFSAAPSVLSKNRDSFLRGVDRIARKAAQDAGRVMVDTTRVDTGLARSNYIASVGSRNNTVIPPYAEGSKLGQGEQANRSGALQQHAAIVSGWNPQTESPFFITNSVPYISFLNNGGAFVQAGNMLQLGLQAAVLSVQSTGRIMI